MDRRRIKKIEDEPGNQLATAKHVKVNDEAVIQSAKFSPKGRCDSAAQNANIRSSISSNKATYEISTSTAYGGKSCQEYSLPLVDNDSDISSSSRLLVLQTSEPISSKKCFSYSKSSSPSIGIIINEKNLDLIEMNLNNKEDINVVSDKQNNDLTASMEPVNEKGNQCLSSSSQKEDSNSTASKKILNILDSKKCTIIDSNVDANINSYVPVQSLLSPPSSSQEQEVKLSQDIDLNENANENIKTSKQTPTYLIDSASILDQYLLSFSESFFLESSSSFPSVVQVSDEIRSERNNNSFWFSSLSNLTWIQLQSNAMHEHETLLVPKSTAEPDKSPTIVTDDMIQLYSPPSSTISFSNHGRGISNDSTSSSLSHLSFSDSSFSES